MHSTTYFPNHPFSSVSTMPKHARKRQKTTKISEHAPSKAARLEMLLDDESKDDEERRLESLLFGVKYVPRDKGKSKASDASDEDEDEDNEIDDGGRGMQHLLDQDVRSIDTNIALLPLLTTNLITFSYSLSMMGMFLVNPMNLQYRRTPMLKIQTHNLILMTTLVQTKTDLIQTHNHRLLRLHLHEISYPRSPFQNL